MDPTKITLDAVVTDKSGAPISGLEPGDFQLLDNGRPVLQLTVHATHSMGEQADPPVEVFLVIDAINMRFLARANQRQWLTSFFKQNGGELPLPTTLVVVTDGGIVEQNQPTRDGKALQAILDSNNPGFRETRTSEGLEGSLMSEDKSLKALNIFALQQRNIPGRKLFLWLGSGWGVTSNPSWFGGPKKMQKIYNYIATLSTALREARITLYQIIPVSGFGRVDGYAQYLKGVNDPKHVDLGDLSLSVLAQQTGGEILTGSSDLAALIEQCTDDVRISYELSFPSPPAARPNEYHALEVRVDRPGFKVRTRSGYYSPNAMAPLPLSLAHQTSN